MINLEKSQLISMNSNLELVGVGLSLESSETPSVDFDLDTSAFMLWANGKIPADNYFVFYKNQKSPVGSVTNDQEDDSTISIPKGKLAADDDAILKAKREALKKKLLEGGKITLKKDGSVTNDLGDDSTISIPKGKLAAQWYENDPALLEAEKAAMHKCFPGFTLDMLDDGRLYWMGELSPGIYETKFHKKMTYTVMAVYNNNHPQQVMGSSVRIYPVFPDVDELIDMCGFRPYHLLIDSKDNLYLCTNEAGNVATGTTTTSAASVLAWAVKWLMSLELVITGDLSKEMFNEHGGV